MASRNWLLGCITAACTVPALASPTIASTPTYSSFQYTQVTSDVYAVPLSSPLTFTPYAPHFSQASTLLPNLTTTSYSYNPTITPSPDGQYGQSAYAALWKNYSYTSSPPFTTTAFATPVAKSELVLPPDLYFALSGPLDLPDNFIWGVASSSWQIEGALQLEGRGPGALDIIGNAPSNQSDSNVAAMNYFLYKQDIARLAAIGIPYYSFSISWSRIVPFGVKGSPINQPGLDHYDDLISTCIQYGVTPIVTLNHVDMPTAVVDDLPNLRAHFLYYAQIVMTRYADRVPYWVTFNEPNTAVGLLVPSYASLTQILLAHADVYTWYKQTLRGTGQITLKFANNLGVPLDLKDQSHVSAANRYQDFILGIMGNPLFLGKQYPPTVLSTPNLDLSPLTEDEITHIHNKIDFWSFDPYTAQYVSPLHPNSTCSSDPHHTLYPTCVTLSNTQLNNWTMGTPSNDYAYIAPQYVRQQLSYVWNTFRPSGILISEFGFNPFQESQKPISAQRFDTERSLYYAGFLGEVVKSIKEDGVNVIGALAWSMVDNNEFGSFEEQYGVQGVNRVGGTFERWFKRSLFDFVGFCRRT